MVGWSPVFPQELQIMSPSLLQGTHRSIRQQNIWILTHLQTFLLSLNDLIMQQYFCRIEADDVQYYLLTELCDEGKNGFDLTISDGEQVWRESGRSESVEY